jgi:hypothetical protein
MRHHFCKLVDEDDDAASNFADWRWHFDSADDDDGALILLLMMVQLDFSADDGALILWLYKLSFFSLPCYSWRALFWLLSGSNGNGGAPLRLACG